MARVLILDDHSLVAELLKQELAEDGHEVLTSSDPVKVISVIQLFVPDIMIVDPFLRKRPRWDVLRQIHCYREEMPIIIYTAHQGYAQDPNMEVARAFAIKQSSMDGIRALVGELISVEKVSVSRGEKIADSVSSEVQPPRRKGNAATTKGEQASFQKEPPNGRQSKPVSDLNSRR